MMPRLLKKNGFLAESFYFLMISGDINPKQYFLKSGQVSIPLFWPIYRLLDGDDLRPPIHRTQDLYFYFCKSVTEYERRFIGQTLPDFFDRSYETKIIIHGWGNWSPLSYYWNLTVGALANPAPDLGPYNIIYVQWKYPATFPLYRRALRYVPDVGYIVADFIRYLVQLQNVDFSSIHLIGHSLGAHVAGVASATVRSYNIPGVGFNNISRITALDPAVLLVSFKPEEKRLTSDDAAFIDVIHSNGMYSRYYPSLGMYASVGHADFYPNGGAIQPGCKKQYPILPIYCHHLRSVEFFAESVTLQSSKFESVYCPDYPTFKSGKCDNNRKASMGIRTLPRTTGTYFLYTRETYPFSNG
ncbi:endothelial lipase-like isoform X2 [Artemia franciscana]|uniref:endothelial lipase-like isoform X2 n=1 Tax=Artemia franciscana TaxID=6661 RepID=UPI0032DB1028